MIDEKELEKLEDKILDLEFARLKKISARQSVVITTPKTPRTGSWQMRSILLKNGKEKNEYRTASGAWIPLPKDLKAWPKELREAEESGSGNSTKRGASLGLAC
jgi:hypothetical protein